MSNVLSLDLATEPAEACVLRVEGRRIEVLERHQHSLEGLFSEDLLSLHSGNGAERKSEEEHSEKDDEQGDQDIQPLDTLLKQVSTPWTNVVVISPAHHFTSLNVTLPFGDAKNIEKIIDMEVQDVVPFDTSEFLLQHRVVDALDDGTFEVHVSLMPKRFVSAVLRVCKRLEIEPLVLSTPTGALSGAYALAPDYFAENSAVVLSTDDQLHVIIAIGGSVKADRVIARCSVDADAGNRNGSGPMVLSPLVELRLAIASAERRYGCTLEKVYFIGSVGESSKLGETLGRSVEHLAPSDLVRGAGNDLGLAVLSAVFVRDEDPPTALTNFRTREFSYSPELKELFSGLRQLMPYFLGFLAAIFISAACLYLVRDLREKRIRSAMREQIQAVSNLTNFRKGKEVSDLLNNRDQLEQQLKHIGAASGFPALDAFLEITHIFARSSDRTIQRIQIKGDRVQVNGTTSSHHQVKKIRDAYSKRKPVRCRLKNETKRTSTSGRVSFEFHARCE